MPAHAAWSMGRYGGYVWSCYGLSLAALVTLVAVARHRWRSELGRARRRAKAGASADGAGV